MSLIFSFLALDEFSQIHEGAGLYFSNHFNANQIVSDWVMSTLSWTLPVGILLIFLTFIFSKFIFNLPKTTRFLFCLSAFIFISDAIGIEVLRQSVYEGVIDKLPSFIYFIVEIMTIEEILEMTGVSLFIYSLLSYVESINIKASIEIRNNWPYFFLSTKTDN